MNNILKLTNSFISWIKESKNDDFAIFQYFYSGFIQEMIYGTGYDFPDMKCLFEQKQICVVVFSNG